MLGRDRPIAPWRRSELVGYASDAIPMSVRTPRTCSELFIEGRALCARVGRSSIDASRQNVTLDLTTVRRQTQTHITRSGC
jgi:hypothetical protein